MARETKDEDNIYFNTGKELSRTSKVLSNVLRVLSNVGSREQSFSILCGDLVAGGFHVLIYLPNKINRD